MPRADKQLTLEHEKLLWNKKELDLDTSKGLLRAVIFYLIKCFAVWQGKELRQLQTSHISFGENKLGKYVSLDFQSLSFKRRRVVKRYDDPANPRSVYKILKKYRSRIANEGPFLVRPISSIKDFICFGPLPLGVRVIKTFISNLMEDAGIGRCFVNYSLNLQSIDTLMRFGTGSHCLSSWLVRNNDKCLRVCPACSSVNCEDINPEVSVTISRLLDAPCPFDAVEILQKMEHEEEQRSKGNDSEVSLKFDSWMINLKGASDEKEMECEQKPRFPVSMNTNLTETQTEYFSDNDLGSKVNIESTDIKGKMLSKDEKVYNTKEVYTCESSYTLDPKIMKVSSITEDAFSLQIDEEDNAGGSSFDENDKELKLNSYLETDKVKERQFKFLSGKKRRKVRSEIDFESDGAFAKMKKNDDCTEYAPWVLSKEFPDLRLKKEVHEISNKEIKLCKNEIKSNYGRDKVHDLKQDVENEAKNFEEKAVQNKQPVFADKLLNNCTPAPMKSGVVKDFKSQKELCWGLRASSSKCKFNLPFPDSSQDSITILRLLLQGQSDNKSKTCDQRKCADANIEKNKYSQSDKMECANAAIDQNKCNKKCKNDCVVNGFVCGNNKINVFEKGDNEDNCSEECEIIVGTEENDKDKQMVIDLSPPTLSPQPVTSSHEIINDVDNEYNDINNHLLSPGSHCAPNLMSPDIVQFLNKAHQQIKHILNATTTKSTIQSENGGCHSIKSIESKPLEKDESSKHSNKSWKPVGIITSTSEHSLSPKVDSVAEESDSNAFTLLKPSKPLEQSPSQFPLLRLFLEQPMEQTELMMSSHSTLGSTLQSSPKKQILLPSNSSSHLHDETDLTQLPQLTYMGDATSSSQLTYMEDTTSSPQLTYMGSVTSFQEMDNSEDDIHKSDSSIDETINSKKCTIKNKKSHSNMVVLSANNQECPCLNLSTQSPSPISVPLLPASPPMILDCQQSNTAVYHVEKDLINNAVYQTLRVNYEKDGVRTFTFADIPNIPENPSHSKKFQGSKQTSEISLGDYFPPGTLIPAKDIHLVTQQGSTGCDIVMKFSFCPKN